MTRFPIFAKGRTCARKRRESDVIESSEEPFMSKAEQYKKLAAVKTMLAEKWEHLSKVSNSIPSQNTFKRRAAKYRRQAADLLRK